jgi:hypothetical protein
VLAARVARKQEVEHQLVVQHRDRLVVKVAALEEIIVSQNKTIEELQEKIRAASARTEIIHGALRYDLLKMTEELDEMKKAQREHQALAHEAARREEQLLFSLHELDTSIKREISDFINTFALPSWTQRAREAWLRTGKQAVDSSSIAQWITEVNKSTINRHREFFSFDNGPLISEASFAPHNFQHGPDAINAVLLALYSTFGDDLLPWEALRPALLCPSVFEKSSFLVGWCASHKLDFGDVGSLPLLLDCSNVFAVTAVAARLLQFALSPSVFYARGGVLPTGEPAAAADILGNLWTAFQSQSRFTPVIAAADNFFVHCATRIDWRVDRQAKRPLSLQEASDRGPFTITPKDASQIAAIDSDKTFAIVQGIIAAHYPFLRQVFLTYGGFVGGSAASSTMSDLAFARLVKDLRVAQAGVLDAATTKSLAGDGLSAKRFVISLLSVAALRFTDVPFPEAVLRLCNRMRMLCSIPQLDTVLDPIIAHDGLTAVIDGVRPDLMKIFRKYAASAGAQNKISAIECAKLLSDLKIIDDGLSANDVQELFALLDSFGGALTFDGFVQFLCVVGTIRIRPPWMPSSARIVRFLNDLVITPLQRKLQLQTLNL